MGAYDSRGAIVSELNAHLIHRFFSGSGRPIIGHCSCQGMEMATLINMNVRVVYTWPADDITNEAQAEECSCVYVYLNLLRHPPIDFKRAMIANERDVTATDRDGVR